MADELEIIVNKRSIRGINTTTKEEYFSTFIDRFRWKRDANDVFTFYNSLETVNNYGAEALNKLGVRQNELGEQTGAGAFYHTDTISPITKVPFTSADAMAEWLGDNTGFFFNPNPVEAEINGVVQTTPNPLLLTETARLRVSELYSQLDLKQIHDAQPLFYDQVNFGSATNVHSTTDTWSTITTVNAGDYSIVQTKQRGNYQSGKPVEVLQTFCGFNTVAGQEIRIGYNTATTTAPHIADRDGYFLSSIDGVIAFEVWKTGTRTSYAEQADWIDPLDGSGGSGVEINWSKVQIMRSTFLWLGVDGISFYLKIGGNLILAHRFTYENESDTVYMSSPNQPVRFEVRQTGATPITFKYICSAIGSDGSINITGKDGGVDDDGTHLDANSTGQWYYAIGLRLQVSKVDALIDIVKGSLLATTNDNFIFRIVLNPTYNGSVTYTDVANYAVSYGLGTTSNTITSMGTILGTGNGAQNSSESFSINNALRIGSNIDGTLDEVAIIVKPLSVNLDIHRSLNFREQI